MDRNIITEADVRGRRREPRPGAVEPAGANAPEPPPGAPTADDYLARLTKYVPIEIVGGYLIIDGLVKSLAKPENLVAGLFGLFVLGLVGSWFYAERVLKVIRRKQLAMTVLAFTLWVFAVGGWFATQGWWVPGYGTVAAVIFGILVKIVDVGPLPPEPTA